MLNSPNFFDLWVKLYVTLASSPLLKRGYKVCQVLEVNLQGVHSVYRQEELKETILLALAESKVVPYSKDVY